MPIDADRFFDVDIRVGTVIEAEPFPEARKPAYKLRVDFGPLGIKRSSAQTTAAYDAAELVGRQVLAVVNLPPRQIATVISEVLVLGIPEPGTDRVILLAPEQPVADGLRIS